jgi:hypothetical protein
MNNDNDQMKDIYPKRSELEADGIYFGNHINPALRPVPKYSFIKDVKKRLKNAAQKIENKVYTDSMKHVDRRIETNYSYQNRPKPIEVFVKERYVKGRGYLSRTEIHNLVKKGYTIKKGKIRRIK